MTDIRQLRAGVAGAGVFGGYHASKYASDSRTEFVGVFDPVSDHARSLCDTHGGQPFDSLDHLIDQVDVLTVASPAVFHHDAARRALTAGKDVLIEKPISATLAEARELVTLAEASGRVLQIGHQERFVFNAMGLFGDLPRLDRLNARRMGTPSARNLDVSVTLDLMIHDIDLVLALAGALPDRVDAVMKQERAGLADHIVTTLSFPGGLVATLESSRVAEDRDRIMDLDYAGDVRVEVDFLTKRFDNPADLPLNRDFADSEDAKDSLGANVKAFVSKALGETVSVPAATGRDGMLALETALRIDQAAGSRSRI